jgi:hypothetical protein
MCNGGSYHRLLELDILCQWLELSCGEGAHLVDLLFVRSKVDNGGVQMQSGLDYGDGCAIGMGGDGCAIGVGVPASPHWP